MCGWVGLRVWVWILLWRLVCCCSVVWGWWLICLDIGRKWCLWFWIGVVREWLRGCWGGLGVCSWVWIGVVLLVSLWVRWCKEGVSGGLRVWMGGVKGWCGGLGCLMWWWIGGLILWCWFGGGVDWVFMKGVKLLCNKVCGEVVWEMWLLILWCKRVWGGCVFERWVLKWIFRLCRWELRLVWGLGVGWGCGLRIGFNWG